MGLQLRPLRLDDEDDARRATAELDHDEFPFLLDRDPGEAWASYLRKLDRYRRGHDLPSDRVPATFLVAVVKSEIVGRVSIRHELNDFLMNLGGTSATACGRHIGDAAMPARSSGRR